MSTPQRLPGGRISGVPFSLTTEDGTHGEGLAEIGPGDPGYEQWDAWLTATAQATPAEGDGPPWTVTGTVPGSDATVTLGWDGGITNWPAEALDWAMDAGEVQLDDGAALLAWLTAQGFTQS